MILFFIPWEKHTLFYVICNTSDLGGNREYIMQTVIHQVSTSSNTTGHYALNEPNERGYILWYKATPVSAMIQPPVAAV